MIPELTISIIIFIIAITIVIRVISTERAFQRILYMHYLMIEILDTQPDIKRIEKYLNKLLENKKLTLSKKRIKEEHDIILDIIKDFIEENKITPEVSFIPIDIKENIYRQLLKLHKDEKL